MAFDTPTDQYPAGFRPAKQQSPKPPQQSAQKLDATPDPLKPANVNPPVPKETGQQGYPAGFRVANKGTQDQYKKLQTPLVPWSQMSTVDQAKMIATHGKVDLDIATSAFQTTLKVIHEAANKVGDKFPTPETITANLLEAPNKILQDPKSLPEEKQKAMKTIQLYNSPLFQATLIPQRGNAIAAAALTTGADWEAMGTLFKPLEWVGAGSKALFGDTQMVRTAVTAANTVLGGYFAHDQIESGVDHWNKGEYGQALSDFGGAGALLLMPALHHIMAEPHAYAGEIDQKKSAELKGRVAKDLEVAKQKAATEENPIFTPEQFSRAQAALQQPKPFDAMTGMTPRQQSLSVDRQAEAQKARLGAENEESVRQYGIAQRERQAQKDVQRLKLDAANKATAAERDKDLADADARSDAHLKRVADEKARFQRMTPPPAEPATPEKPAPREIPAPDKRAYQDPATIIAGRQPMTAQEREDQRFNDRVDEAKKQLAAEKQRRLDVAGAALRQGLDVEKRQLDQIAERRAAAVRAGENFTVNDRRGTSEGSTDAPAAPQGLEPAPPPEPADVRALEGHEAAATWSILEYEKRLGKAKTPEERAELQKEIDENKQLLEDVRADKQTARMVGGTAPAQHKAGDQIASKEGNKGTLKTVTRDIPISYKLVEGDDLKTSHDPHTFEPVKGYPDGVQERDYKNDKDAQVAVIQHGQKYDPAFTISDAPGPEHGPPVVTPDGIVLGGNSRVMSTMRHYGDEGKAYREALAAKARQFGIDPAQLEGMKNPVLVREITDPPKSINELRALGSDLNRVFTRKLSEYEQAVSAGKRISQETMDYVGGQLVEGGYGTSIRDLLRDRSGPIIEKLMADGIIAQNELRALIDDKTGTLNETGKDFVERALLGAVVDDPVVLANSPKSVLRRVERALPSLAQIKARGEPWDITDYLKEALREHITAASKGEDIHDHLDPPTMAMFAREPVHPIVDAIARTLDQSAADVRGIFEEYAEDAAADVKGQGGLGFFTPPKPWESFNRTFDANVKESDWGTLDAAEPEPTPEPAAAPEKALDPTPPSRREQFSNDIARAFPNVTPEQREAVLAIIDARAHTVGETTDQWLEKRIGGVEETKNKKGAKQRHAAMVEFAKDGRDILRAFTDVNPTVEALVHEVGHIFRRDLRSSEVGNPASVRFLDEWLGQQKSDERKGGDMVWTRAGEEKFARAFELYLKDGRAPVPELEGVFGKFKEWLGNILKFVKGSLYQGKSTPTGPNISAFFDRMLGGTGTHPEGFRPADAPRTPETTANRPADAAPTPLDATPKEPVAKTDPLPRRTLNIFRGANGMVRVEFPDTNHADLFSALGRDKRHMTEYGTRGSNLPGPGLKADWDGISHRMGIPKEDLRRIAVDYRDHVMEAVKGIKEGETFKAPNFKEVPRGEERRYSTARVDPNQAAKAMSDEELRKVVEQAKTNASKPFLRREQKQTMLDMAKPFEEELSKRGGKGGEDRSVIFTKDRFQAALDALKKNNPDKPTKLYSNEPEDKMVDTVSVVMGHLFENGYRDYESNLAKMVDLAGEYTRPYARAAFDRMLNEGKKVASTKLQGIIPEQERVKYSSQLGLFEEHQAKSRRIELPKGVDVSHETRQSSKPNDFRKELDARPGSEGRAEAGRTAQAANQPRGGDPLGGSGRDVRPVGEGNRGGGIQEKPARPLRTVQAPSIDVENKPTLNPTVESGEWRNRLVGANLAAEIPPPTRGISEKTDRKLLFKGQPEIVQTVLTSLDKYGAAVLATTTGTGKTYTGSAIFAEERPRFGLILTPSGNLNDNWINTAKEFGVDVKKFPAKGVPTEPGVYVSTYKTAAAREGMEKVGWNLMLADEAHKARRWYAGTGDGMFLKNLANATDKVVFASATPFHSALEMGYMDKLGIWKKQGFENWAGKEFNTRKSDQTGKWISPFNPRKLAALRQELINRGMFVNLDRDMRGYDVNFAISHLKPEEAQGLKSISKAFKLAQEYFTQRGRPEMVQAVRGNATTFVKSFLERARLPEAIELGKKLEKQGWKVAFFTENKTEVSELYDFLKDADRFYGGEISRLMPKLPGVIDTLQQHFGDDIADFSGAHNANRQEELDAFNRGDKKHIVATYGAGGLGVSMHDQSEGGKAPRAAIYLGPPYSGVMLDQAIGRPWRFGTNSNVQAYFLTSNAAPEVRLMLQKVKPRFESLKAAVSGVKKVDPILEQFKNLDAQLDYEMGNPDKSSLSEYMETMNTDAISSVQELKIPAASEAMGKGMQVERRKLEMAPLPETPKEPKQPDKLFTNDPAGRLNDLVGKMNDLKSARNESGEAAKTVRRPLVPSETEKEISDPRMLDYIQDQNANATGAGGEAKPPKPPDEILGEAQIPPPGKAAPEYDLADPKMSRAIHEYWKDRTPNLDSALIDKLARLERGKGAFLAQLHTAPYVLNQFEMTKDLPRMFMTTERTLRRNVAEKKFLKNEILKDFKDDQNSRRRIFEALQRSHDPARELAGASSEWVDHQPFTTRELASAQRLRDEIFDPMIEEVMKVRPDVGRRWQYAPITKQIDELTPLLYPELGGKIPADLIPEFSLEVRQSLTKDPFSPHELRRKSTPPRALDIDEALEAYIPSMQRLADLTPASRTAAIHLAGMPESALKDYAKKYARIFFGVPSEYAHLEKIHTDFARTLANMTYSAALDLNPHFFAIHSLKVPWNVWPELGKGGTGYAVKGYLRATTAEGKELVARSGVLMDAMQIVRQPKNKTMDRFGKFLHYSVQLSDQIDRSVAYLGGLEKAKDLGFFGPKEGVGQITWDRLNDLAASGVDIKKGLDYAYEVAARSNFMYTAANVQMAVRDNPISGMFKSFAVRQAEFAMNIRTLAKEAKAQGAESEEIALQKAANGDYQYIDAQSKYRRFLMSTAVLALGTKQIEHFIGHLLSPPIAFANDTFNLLQKTLSGHVKEEDWQKWFTHGIETFVPGAGYIVRKLDPLPEPFTIQGTHKKDEVSK